MQGESLDTSKHISGAPIHEHLTIILGTQNWHQCTPMPVFQKSQVDKLNQETRMRDCRKQKNKLRAQLISEGRVTHRQILLT